jgi:chromate transporter
MSFDVYWDLFWVFTEISFISLGGGTASLAQMQWYSVHQFHWITAEEFIDFFAISQAAPGPSMLIVSLIGYKAASWYGMTVATVATFAPACVLTYIVSRVWKHFHDSPWREPVEKGLSAVTVGLIFASALIVSKHAANNWEAYVLVGASAIILSFSKLNPFILMILAGILGYYGIVR